MAIKFHSRAWQCPKCGNYKRVRDNGSNIRYAKCCNQQFKILTGWETRTVSELVIRGVKKLY